MPLVGDWDGNGTDTIGLYDPVWSMFYLRNTLTTGMADLGVAVDGSLVAAGGGSLGGAGTVALLALPGGATLNMIVKIACPCQVLA